VEQRAKNGVFGVLPAREMGRELLYFCSRPIFRAGKTPKTPFFALCSTETLATQATSILTGLIASLTDL